MVIDCISLSKEFGKIVLDHVISLPVAVLGGKAALAGDLALKVQGQQQQE